MYLYKTKYILLKIIIVIFIYFLSISSYAAVIPEASRIVFDLSKNEQSLRIYNNNDYPVLVQLWSDNGGIDSSPDTASESPILPLPAIFKLMDGESKVIRLVKVESKLQTDRETLFWLNIYEVPPLPDKVVSESGKSVLMVAVRTQIKIILRPPELFEKFNDLIKNISFDWKEGCITLINNSPFYMTISSLTLTDNDEDSFYNDMIDPFSKIIASCNIKIKPDSLFVNYINDQGSITSLSIKK